MKANVDVRYSYPNELGCLFWEPWWGAVGGYECNKRH